MEKAGSNPRPSLSLPNSAALCFWLLQRLVGTFAADGIAMRSPQA
jgi:hypothetical protein